MRIWMVVLVVSLMACTAMTDEHGDPDARCQVEVGGVHLDCAIAQAPAEPVELVVLREGEATTNLCRDDPDTCPGGHPITLRQEAELEGRDFAAQHGYTIQGTPAITCTSDGFYCHGDFYVTNTMWIMTNCYSGAPRCGVVVCNQNEGGTATCTYY